MEVGAELLAAFGSFPALAVARPEALARATSIGAAKAAGLVAAFELGRRAASATRADRSVAPSTSLPSSRIEMGEHRREEAFVIVVNGAHGVIEVGRLTTGIREMGHA